MFLACEHMERIGIIRNAAFYQIPVDFTYFDAKCYHEYLLQRMEARIFCGNSSNNLDYKGSMYGISEIFQGHIALKY
jgi:hypothetical protein